MEKPLRVLILEDRPADAEIIQFELEEAGFVPAAKVVRTEEDYIRELEAFWPRSHPFRLRPSQIQRRDGACRSKKRCPDIPFILVTGAVTEDRAIES